ncbi:hypothetical protein [Lonepinella sp. MS14435]|uniref:hypothetical protein n=1 Tax=Lonepinella sp. MS14435 TaxID=3003618 RepID=UPI0036DB61F4
MAIPFIIGAAAGISALTGLYKGTKAVINNNEASDINDSAKSLVKSAERDLDNSREACNTALNELGRSKIAALENCIKKFVDIFSQLKNVEFSKDQTLENLKLAEFSPNVIREVREQISMLATSGLGLGGGAAAGAVTAFGAYSGTMALATASTGTAISSLSGAAATNATLAWLGGGSLASGGLGMAGGTLVLGAAAAGPALLLAGWYMNSKSEKSLNDAKSNMAQARAFKADADKSITLTNGITEIARFANNVLSKIKPLSRRSTKELIKVVNDFGLDYSSYNNEAKTIVMRSLKLVQLLKAVIDTPILDENGNLLNDAEANIFNIQQAIS